MIIRKEDLQEICGKILFAVDSTETSAINETLELKTVDTSLFVNVSNRDYYAQVKVDIGEKIDFHATVNATLFLKLVSQFTTDTIELYTKDNSLHIKADGNYKIPLIYDGTELLELPEIKMENVTEEFNIDSSILHSIFKYNTKQIQSATVIANPVQQYYYIDNKGAITFTTGACVNNFDLPGNVAILLNMKIVKLFRLFKDGKVKFSIGHSAIDENTVRTKVKFETDNIGITAILPIEESLVSSVPVSNIRGVASFDYPYSIVVNKDSFIKATNRLLLFNERGLTNKPYGSFKFTEDSFIVEDYDGVNAEKVNYENDVTALSSGYSAILDLKDVKMTLEGCSDQTVTINFGNSKAFVIVRGNISNVIPEVKVNRG